MQVQRWMFSAFKNFLLWEFEDCITSFYSFIYVFENWSWKYFNVFCVACNRVSEEEPNISNVWNVKTNKIFGLSMMKICSSILFESRNFCLWNFTTHLLLIGIGILHQFAGWMKFKKSVQQFVTFYLIQLNFKLIENLLNSSK